MNINYQNFSARFAPFVPTHVNLPSYTTAQNNSKLCMKVVVMFSVPYSLPIVVVALGIAAAAQITSLSETTQL